MPKRLSVWTSRETAELCLSVSHFIKKQDLEKEGVNIAGTEWSEWTGGERLEFGCV